MAEQSPAKQAVDRLLEDLRAIFGKRLQSLIIYGRHAVTPVANIDDPLASGAPQEGIHTLALVESLSFEDVHRCARAGTQWVRRGLAVPLILTRAEFTRSLDAFPLEYGAIIAGHVVVAGEDPLEDARVMPEDLRRACEVQAKSHLLHLREAYIEAGGQQGSVARILTASAAPFRGLLYNLARLQGDVQGPIDLIERAGSAGLPADVIREVLEIDEEKGISGAQGMKLFPAYLAAVEELTRILDTWTA